MNDTRQKRKTNKRRKGRESEKRKREWGWSPPGAERDRVLAVAIKGLANRHEGRFGDSQKGFSRRELGQWALRSRRRRCANYGGFGGRGEGIRRMISGVKGERSRESELRLG